VVATVACPPAEERTDDEVASSLHTEAVPAVAASAVAASAGTTAAL
jgi:hypothetical protein